MANRGVFSCFQDCFGFIPKQNASSSLHEAASNTVITDRTPLLSAPMSIDNSKGTVGRVAVKYQSYGSISSPTSQAQEQEHKGKIIIHCVRHAQALHNLNLPNSTKESRASIPDPPLTAAGYKQCALLSLSPPFPLSGITHVFSSPSIRCIETASLSFRGLFTSSLTSSTNTESTNDIDDGESTISDNDGRNSNQGQDQFQDQRHKIVLWADLKELGPRPCNNGSGIEILKREFKDLDPNIHYGLLDEGWEERSAGHEYGGRVKLTLNIRKTLYETGLAALQDKRANADGNVEILVISHGGLLGVLTKDTNHWHNAEVRSFELTHQIYQSHRPKDRYSLFPIPTSTSNSTTPTFPLDLPSFTTLRTLGWKRSELAILKPRAHCTVPRKKTVLVHQTASNPNTKPKPKPKSKLLSCQVQGRIMTYCRGSRRGGGDSDAAREDGRKRWQGFRILGGY